MTIEELTKQLQDHLDEARAVQAAAETETRCFTAEESQSIDEHLQAAKSIEGDIELRSRLDASEERQNKVMAEVEPRKTEADPPGNKPDIEADEAAIRSVPATAADNRHRGSCGFRSFGEFAQSLVKAGRRANPVMDPRLEIRTATSTFGNELAGADGGFAVPPDFATTINNLIFDEEGLLGRTDQMTSASNAMTVPMDDDSPWSSSGITANWDGEGDAMTPVKPLLKQNEVRLNKLTCLVPMTEELLEDAAAMSSYVPRKAASKMNFKIDLAIVQGSGAGQPQGILSAPATISVSKGSSAADKVTFENIRDMWAKLYAPSRPTSIWLANQDVEPQLQLLEWTDLGSTPISAQPIYIPNGNLAGAPFTTLYGRPIIFHQACETLGDLGDILLVDLSQYLTITRGGGIRSDMSMHMWFDQDLVAFKFRIRIGGLPWWPGTLAARDGSGTYSPFVSLAERA